MHAVALSAVLLAACGPNSTDECERAGGHNESYNCHDYSRLEYIGGNCGWSLSYCEGAMPYTVVTTTCDQRCVQPVHYQESVIQRDTNPHGLVDIPARMLPGGSSIPGMSAPVPGPAGWW